MQEVGRSASRHMAAYILGSRHQVRDGDMLVSVAVHEKEHLDVGRLGGWI